MGGDGSCGSGSGPSPERAGTSSEGGGSRIGGGGAATSSGNQAKTMTSARSITSGNKHKKIVRVLTVVAYVCSVSTAAVLLSAYYIFLWKPQPSQQPEASQSTMAMARVAPLTPTLASSSSSFFSSDTNQKPSASFWRSQKPEAPVGSAGSSGLRAFQGSSAKGADFKRAAILNEEETTKVHQELLPVHNSTNVMATQRPSQVPKDGESAGSTALTGGTTTAKSPTNASSVLVDARRDEGYHLPARRRRKRRSSEAAATRSVVQLTV